MKDSIKISEPVEANGIKLEVADKIKRTLDAGRRYFGSAGASLTHLISNPDVDTDFKIAALRKGIEGERQTSKIIRKWAKDKPSAILIDSVHIKGYGKSDSEGDTDHVLIIGNHVILIDSKKWAKRRKYSISPKGRILRSNKYFPGGKVNATQAKFLWKKYLHKNAKVSSIVCINAPQVFVQMDGNWKKQVYKLYPIDKLIEHLDWRYEKMSEEDKTTINSTLVAQIALCCIKPYDEYTNVFNMESIKDFK